ncbi:MAG: hypothetical protein MJ189_04345 [Coriobacteriales bacterium]|nr:hypothetical protein [Coriobacteriales bacterium]
MQTIGTVRSFFIAGQEEPVEPIDEPAGKSGASSTGDEFLGFLFDLLNII